MTRSLRHPRLHLPSHGAHQPAQRRTRDADNRRQIHTLIVSTLARRRPSLPKGRRAAQSHRLVVARSGRRGRGRPQPASRRLRHRPFGRGRLPSARSVCSGAHELSRTSSAEWWLPDKAGLQFSRLCWRRVGGKSRGEVPARELANLLPVGPNGKAHWWLLGECCCSAGCPGGARPPPSGSRRPEPVS